MAARRITHTRRLRDARVPVSDHGVPVAVRRLTYNMHMYMYIGREHVTNCHGGFRFLSGIHT